jgi:hypothetical protein
MSTSTRTLDALRTMAPSPRLVRGLAAESDTCPSTVIKLLRGEPVRRSVADRIVKALVTFGLLADAADVPPRRPDGGAPPAAAPSP